MKIDYSKDGAPLDYKCKGCGAVGCKLWREYQTVNPTLLCAVCAGKDQNKSIEGIDEQGMRPNEPGMMHPRTDQIGWYVPAIPDEEGIGYWGYTSVPQVGIDWWYRLPTLPNGNPQNESDTSTTVA